MITQEDIIAAAREKYPKIATAMDSGQLVTSDVVDAMLEKHPKLKTQYQATPQESQQIPTETPQQPQAIKQQTAQAPVDIPNIEPYSMPTPKVTSEIRPGESFKDIGQERLKTFPGRAAQGFGEAMLRVPVEHRAKIEDAAGKIGYEIGRMGERASEFGIIKRFFPSIPMVAKIPLVGNWVSNAIIDTGIWGGQMLTDELASSDRSIERYKKEFKQSAPLLLALEVAPYISGLRYAVTPEEITLMQNIIGRGYKAATGFGIAAAETIREGGTLKDALNNGLQSGLLLATGSPKMEAAGLRIKPGEAPLKEYMPPTELPPTGPVSPTEPISPIRKDTLDPVHEEAMIVGQAKDITNEMNKAMAEGDVAKVLSLNKKLSNVASQHEKIIKERTVAAEQPVAQTEQPAVVETAAPTEPIPAAVPFTYKPSERLQGEAKDVETKFGEQIKSDLQKSIEEYKAAHGNVINTDLARELSPDYSKDKESRSKYADAVHEPASELTKKVYDSMIADHESLPGNNSVVFTAGGTGAGKSTGTAAEIPDQPKIIYDSNLNNFNKNIQKIDKALNAGLNAEIYYTYRSPEKAFDNMLKRAMRMGRTVPISEHLNTHIGSHDAIKKMIEHYANDDRVNIEVYDNDGAKGESRKLNKSEIIPYLDTITFNRAELEKKLSDRLDEALKNNEITKVIYDNVKIKGLKLDKSGIIVGKGGEEYVRQKEDRREQEAKVEHKPRGQGPDGAVVSRQPEQPSEPRQVKLNAYTYIKDKQGVMSYVPTKGERVEIHPDIDTMMNKFDGEWKVSELRSGLSLSSSSDKEMAIRQAKDVVDRHGIDKVISKIDEAVAKQGESPYMKERGEERVTKQRRSDQPVERAVTDTSVPEPTREPGAERDTGRGAGEIQRRDVSERSDVSTGEPSLRGLESIPDEAIPAVRANNQSLAESEIKKPIVSKEDAEKFGYIQKGSRKGAEGVEILSAYFTPPELSEIMQNIISSSGANSILEPSVGDGGLLTVLSGMPGRDIVSVEINQRTANIVKSKYPESTVYNTWGEKFFHDNTKKFDAIISNPPYNTYSSLFKGLYKDKKADTYTEFFMRESSKALKDGGTMVFLVPHSFLGGTVNNTKSVMEKEGMELMSAWRLPDGIFGKSVNIPIDLLVFKKTGKSNYYDLWYSNNYFERFPDRVLGEIKQGQGYMGRPVELVVGSIPDAYAKIKADLKAEPPVPMKPIEELKIQEPTENPPVKRITYANDVEVAKKKQPSKKTKPATEAAKKDGITETHDIGNPDDEKIFNDLDYDGNVKTLKGAEYGDKLNFIDGKWKPDIYYTFGNIRERMNQLEEDKGKISEKQYNKQKALLESVMPKYVPASEMKLDPKLEYFSDIQRAFTDWLYETRPYEKNIGYQDIVGYIHEQKVYGYDAKSKEDQIRKATFMENRRQAAVNQFTKFLQSLESAQGKHVIDKINYDLFSTHTPNFLDFPFFVKDISKTFGPGNKPLVINNHQIEAINFLHSRNLGYFAGEVGSGKTMVGCIATEKALQSGKAKRPVLVAPTEPVANNFLTEYKNLFPNREVVFLGNLGSTVKLPTMKDGTVYVMTKSAFDNITYKEETLTGIKSFLEQQTKKGDEKRQTEINSLKIDEKFISKVIGKGKFFEDLGFDMMVADEAHDYKNLFSYSSSQFKGMGTAQSNIAIRAYTMATQIMRQNNMQNVILLSGTPFNNQAVEIYNVLAFVGYGKMQDMGVGNINDFFSTYANTNMAWVVKADGSMVKQQVTTGFRNSNSLRQLIRSYVLPKFADDLDLDRPSKERIMVRVESNQATKDVKKMLDDAMVAARNLPREERAAETLRLFTEYRKLAVSPYLVTGTDVNSVTLVNNSPKLKNIMEQIANVKKQDKDCAQIIAMPIGKELIHHLKAYLIEKVGYKEGEVGVISGETGDKTRQANIDKLNNGTFKVLIGSDVIQKGVNLQHRAGVLYMPVIDWNPTNVLQWEGRIFRQGSPFHKVHIVFPILEDSMDSVLLQKMEEKSKRFNDIWAGKDNYIDVSDIDPEELKLELITDPERKADMAISMRRDEMQLEKSIDELEMGSYRSASFSGHHIENYKSLAGIAEKINKTLNEDFITPSDLQVENDAIKELNKLIEQHYQERYIERKAEFENQNPGIKYPRQNESVAEWTKKYPEKIFPGMPERRKPSETYHNIDRKTIYYPRDMVVDNEGYAKLLTKLDEGVTKARQILSDRLKEYDDKLQTISDEKEMLVKKYIKQKEDTPKIVPVIVDAPPRKITRPTKPGFVNIGPIIEVSEKALPVAKDVLDKAMVMFEGRPKVDDWRLMVGKRASSITWGSRTAKAFFDKLMKDTPDLSRRAAIAKWIDSGGKESILKEGLERSTKPATKQAYKDAMTLTANELETAKWIQDMQKSMAESAINEGIEINMIDDYLHRTYKDKKKIQNLMASLTLRNLTMKPGFAKKRKFDYDFEAELAGLEPEPDFVKRFVSLYLSWNKTMADRKFVNKLMKMKASDGRPMVDVAGIGQPIEDDGGYYIKPDSKRWDYENPENARNDYSAFPHPALKKWKWVGELDGKPILMRGDAIVHPEIYPKIKSLLGPSAISTHPVGKAVLNVSSTVKQTMLDISAFHPVQIGIHAAEHRVNLMDLVELDYNEPIQRALTEHGLTIGGENVELMLYEGSGGGAKSLIRQIPWLADLSRMWNATVFEEFIPRVKMTMALEAYERNRKRFPDLSEHEILSLTARQSNNAFGGLNWDVMGISKTMQDILRIGFLAPDFLIARFGFVAEAGTKYGREQLVALTLGAATLYIVARLLNKMIDDDWHLEIEHAFSIVYKGHAYSLRTVQGDILHLFNKKFEFFYSRLNPFLLRPVMEAVTGRDYFGRKRDFLQQVYDEAMIAVPIAFRGMLPGQRQQTIMEALLQSVGITNKRYTVINEMQDKVKSWKKEQGIKEYTEIISQETPEKEFKRAVIAGEDDIAYKYLDKAVKAGIPTSKIRNTMKLYATSSFAGSIKNDKAFYETLSDIEKVKFDAAKFFKKQAGKRADEIIDAYVDANNISEPRVRRSERRPRRVIR